MRLALSCAALLALAAPVAAQSNAERVVNDAYTRSHDYDLVHQRIEVRNFDWDSTSLDGRVTTTLVALRPGLDSVILDAGKGLVVSRVVDARGTSLRSTAHGDTLVVYPARVACLPRHAALFDRLPRAHRQRPRADVHRARGPGA